MPQTTNYTGLSDAQVQENRAKYGENILTPPHKTPLWKLFLEKFQDPIIRILLIAAFLSLGIAFVHNDFIETIGIFCAIFLATGVAFWFEVDANKKFDILNQVNDDIQVKVIRNENICQISRREIVVGDIILLETGEEVPADGQLLEAISLQVDESCLTGELSISKTTNPQYFNNDATYPSDSVLRGTKIIDGHGVVEIQKVGDNTEYGKVAEQATETSTEETPLNKQLDLLAKFISVIGFTLALFTFCSLFLKDLFVGSTSYSLGQFGLLAAAIAGIALALAKIWLPIVYNAFDLLGKAKKFPKRLLNIGWLTWIGLGTLLFLTLAGIGYLLGVNPFETASWVSIETTGHILQYFMIAVTLVVVAVPEGLPMSVTLSLAMSMRRMLKTNNLVRKMHACETMGAVTVICTDKTGTLTQNKMQVHETNFYNLPQHTLDDTETGILVKESIALNSTAFLDFSDTNHVKAIGNPTESALLLWLHSNGINYFHLRKDTPVVEQLTFSTERKFMATLIDSPLLNKRILYMKGAPEIVLNKCRDVFADNGMVPVSEYKDTIMKQLHEHQNHAMRTLGFAYKYVDKNEKLPIENLVDDGLTFLGIAAISDPIRKDVPAAVNECLEAGIEVKIVTGDTPGTAKEIARQVGIWNENENPNAIITGSDFEALPEDEAAERVRYLRIMCRARPSDKQRLVRLLQQNGEVVAVTGDGTNDAPALNYAQVGLSMGSGTSVAKEASDITLLDDSFKSIATAVMWGRSLYQNIQRFILFQLTINVVAMVIVCVGSLFGQELPLTVTQMLWVNLIMDTFAAGALASLPPNKNVMKDKPRHNNDFIITKAMRTGILAVGLSFVLLLLGFLYYLTSSDGRVNEYDLSLFFTVFVLLQFWNMFNAKAFLTGKSAFANISQSIGFIIVAGIILIGQVIIVEFGGEVFRTVPLSLKDWIIIIVSTSVVLWIGEFLRFFKRTKSGN